jgi:hypothetical protein
MNKENKVHPKIWIQIPENFYSMSDEEIESFIQSLWEEIKVRLGDAREA